MIYPKNRTLKGGYMIKINEIFGPTIQGEGKSAGKEVIFLRLAGCNLRCRWCDTPYTWNWIGTKFQHPDKYDPKKEIVSLTPWQVFWRILPGPRMITNLVISGGEPLLQQSQLIPLLQIFKRYGWWIEVETNGTIVPTDEFLSLVDQINCSPKTSNSGEDNPSEKRERPEALRKLVSSPKVYFKFVVVDMKDILEIQSLVNKYEMKQVYLMAEGKTREEQLTKEKEVESVAQLFGWLFSPRLQVLKWGNKRGV